ncbi:LOW QUALITY PROTEIN: hypothetical protein CRUP_008535 [Coryphaenoides rupestris]|nr:LOW QUALITY PROTEIN: hypothetical protein CRUP_008535 [Coryphaenoides rupestris]
MLPGVLLSALLCFVVCADGGKVLVVPVDGSHWINMKVLVEELHFRGHHITVLRPNNAWYIKEDSPHYITITSSSSGDDLGDMVSRIISLRRAGASFWHRMSLEVELLLSFRQFHLTSIAMLENMLEDKELMQSLQEAGYDLVLTDPAIVAGIMLARCLGLPLVLNVRWTTNGEGHGAIAPTPLSYVPITGAELTDKMSFTQRVKNILCHLFTQLQFALIIEPNYGPLVQRYFGVHYMELDRLPFDFPRPTMPNIVYMAGFQCKPSKPLPPDMEAFVQSAGEHGVIVMTLGTLVGALPEELTEDIAAAFAQLPQKVAHRQEALHRGNNTLLLDWLPQNDLLGHPKTKLFVAHGGTNGIQEAIYHGVPLLGLPLMFDQLDNFSKVKARGVAKVLELSTVNKDSFLSALKEVLHQPSYRDNMQRLSALHRDQPIKPLEKAMFWIEFVMRHKGAPHLRTDSYKMSALQYHCIDVALVLLAALLLFLLLSVSTLRFFWSKVVRRSKAKVE